MEQKNNAALLVMDMQTRILGMVSQEAATTIIANVNKAIAHAHTENIPVIYVVVGFRAGAPEVSDNNKGFSAGGYKGNLTEEQAKQFIEIHPEVARRADDIVVTKRRVSAFTGSDLEVVLSGLNIRHIVLSGVATSGVVLSTLREAADKDFQITVLTDCCLDRDEEVHRVLTIKVFKNQSETLTVNEWVK
ncbi:MAG: cysteine hydrolase [Chitinophagaceae bacterium]|jgi:nicotinamidase-related amidase|nr:cysteine hydrolase [Chitinophagaceae bacterium]